MLISLVLVGATWVLAQDAGWIHACVYPTDSLRIVADGQACRLNEHQLSWNEQGPPGLPGPHGEQGEPCVPEYYLVIGDSKCPSGGTYSTQVWCNAGGKVTVGGGHGHPYLDLPLTLSQWIVVMDNQGWGSGTILADSGDSFILLPFVRILHQTDEEVGRSGTIKTYKRSERVERFALAHLRLNIVLSITMLILLVNYCTM